MRANPRLLHPPDSSAAPTAISSVQAIAPGLREEEMPETRPTLVCAWCGVTIETGSRAISHGLCEECQPEVVRGLLSAAPSVRAASRRRRGA